MPKVMTVCGLKSVTELGHCQSHEHLMIRKGYWTELVPSLCMEDADKSAGELLQYKNAGGGCVVDAQPVGNGRMAKELQDISLRSGVHIIASTGFHKLSFYPASHWIHTLPREELIQLFISEFSDGMLDNADGGLDSPRTAVRCGVIKTAVDNRPLNARETVLFEAAGAAAIQTGMSVLCHTEDGAHAEAIVELLTGMGVEAGRIIICHADRTLSDLDRLVHIAEVGVYLELDTIGRFKYHDDASEMQAIAHLVRAGHADKLLLGLDDTNQRLKAYGGDIGLDYLFTQFIPAMEQDGLAPESIRQWTHENAYRAFALRTQTII